MDAVAWIFALGDVFRVTFDVRPLRWLQIHSSYCSRKSVRSPYSSTSLDTACILCGLFVRLLLLTIICGRAYFVFLGAPFHAPKKRHIYRLWRRSTRLASRLATTGSSYVTYHIYVSLSRQFELVLYSHVIPRVREHQQIFKKIK